jgi:hypothetical protein
MSKTPRLDQVSREWMLRSAHNRARKSDLRGVPLWSFVGDICCVGSTSAGEICRELGWDPCAPAIQDLPGHYRNHESKT